MVCSGGSGSRKTRKSPVHFADGSEGEVSTSCRKHGSVIVFSANVWTRVAPRSTRLVRAVASAVQSDRLISRSASDAVGPCHQLAAISGKPRNAESNSAENSRSFENRTGEPAVGQPLYPPLSKICCSSSVMGRPRIALRCGSC